MSGGNHAFAKDSPRYDAENVLKKLIRTGVLYRDQDGNWAVSDYELGTAKLTEFGLTDADLVILNRFE